jgi:hypothetical protein
MKAYMIMQEQIIRDWHTGTPLDNYAGEVTIFDEAKATVFKTGFDNGERFWEVK